MPPGFIELGADNVAFLLMVGFIGGLVSGFIGSGGAFVLTPGMMSMGISGAVAVASNLCHKFPKALVGAYRRYQFGQVDVKLGLIMAASAGAGVWVGAGFMEHVRLTYGPAGSSLYVSLVFVVVLTAVGSFVLRDALQLRRRGHAEVETTHPLARWVQSVNIPGTMIEFKVAKIRVSALFTLPLGFATGLLASSIAVGGFVGVPGMIYVLGAPTLVASATELVIAFVMGLIGTTKYAMAGIVDIRLAMLILLGSLFGVQLGAIGTTYVRAYVVKLVTAVIMLIVAVSRLLVVPVHLAELEVMSLKGWQVSVLKNVSFALMVAALVVGATIILGSMLRGRTRASA
ncbi:MAG TPA: sulfite exporter TauE/SafE family protein [Burkholderiales bacterium]|nr:sulfite exporter TauE/SafE family protein [Burkholderiales bacterium]